MNQLPHPVTDVDFDEFADPARPSATPSPATSRRPKASPSVFQERIADRNARIVDAVAQGTDQATVARTFDVSVSTVSLVCRNAGVRSTRPGARAGSRNPARDVEIARRAKNGETFTDIARAYGLTRERVRQIVNRQTGLTAGDMTEIRTQVRRTPLLEAARAYADAHPNAPVAEIAENSGASYAEVRLLLSADELAVRRQGRPESGLSDADLLVEIRRVASLAGGAPLTRAFYDAHRRPDSVGAGRALQRFGTWTAACEAAGVIAMAPIRGNYERRWTRDDLVDWVVAYLDVVFEKANRPTYAGLRTWLAGQPDGPSAETVRLYCGKWIPLLREAVERRRARHGRVAG